MRTHHAGIPWHRRGRAARVVTPLAVSLVALAVACGGSSPARHSISGTVTGASVAVTVALTGAATASTTASQTGSYSFAGLADGTYTVAPTAPGYVCDPAERTVTVRGSDVTGVDFAAAEPTHEISGRVTSGAQPLAGVAVAVSGPRTATIVTDASGAFAFAGAVDGSYTLTPSLANWVFTPPQRSVIVEGADVAGVDFQAAAARIQVVDNDMDVPTSWTSAHVYVVTKEVRVNAPLAIGPGTVVMFMRGGALNATGVVTARGLPEAPIIFTSYQDDATAAGDVNGDGAASTAAAGDWRGILAGAEGSTFEHCRFLYAGEGDAPALSLGIVSNGVVRNSVFAHDRGQDRGLASAPALKAIDSGPDTVIEGNAFYDDVVPLWIGPWYSLGDSNVFENPEAPYGARQPSTYNAVVATVPGNQARLDVMGNIAWRATKVPFVVGTPDGNARDLVLERGNLTLGAGVVVKFQAGLDAALRLQEGTLNHEANVVLTSVRDDFHAGDTNGDGTATAPGARDWYGIAGWNGCESWPGMHHFWCGPAQQEGPILQLTFSPATTSLDGSTYFETRVRRPDAAALTGVSATVPLPPGLVFPWPAADVPFCGGRIVVTERSVTLSGLAPSTGGCSVTASLSPIYAGVHEVAAMASSREGGPGNRTTTALTASPGAGGLAFHDAFERPNGAVGRGWYRLGTSPDSPVPTSWAEVVSGALRVGPGFEVIHGDPAWGDYTVQARFQVPALAIPVGLLFRISVDQEQSYRLVLSGGSAASLQRRSAASWGPELAHAAVSYDANAWHTFKFAVSGGRIQTWLDGASAPAIDYVDPSPIPRGNFGLFVDKAPDSALFDDVVVTMP